MLWWTQLYCGVASVIARQQELRVYRSVWVRCLKRIQGGVRVSFVPQSVVHVAVMYACKIIPSSLLNLPISHAHINCAVWTKLHYSCLLLRTCWLQCFFVYCVLVFTAVIFAKSNSPTCNCNDTFVNWFIKEQFCNLHVWFMFIRAINPLKNPFKNHVSGMLIRGGLILGIVFTPGVLLLSSFPFDLHTIYCMFYIVLSISH
jgi:hypothetical protein